MKPTARFITWTEIEGFSGAQDQETFKAEVNAEGCESFLEAHPEYLRHEAVAERVQEFLSRGDRPMVRQNLELAYTVLDIPRITQIEEPEPEEPKRMILNPVVAAQTSQPDDEEREHLEKLGDIPYLSDAQRRIRDEKLRRAAIASRDAHRRHSPAALVG
jgi:hypothetical protein